MKQHFCGCHIQRRRRRRKLKAVTLAAMATAMALMVSWTPPRVIQPPGRWENPTPTELGTARRYCEINGAENGASPWYLDIWEPYAPYIRGEVDTIEECGNENAAPSEDAPGTAMAVQEADHP